MSNNQDDETRMVPQNDLDFNLITTTPGWGTNEINPELKEKLKAIIEKYDEKGEKVTSTSDLWSLLNFYTRDVRLGNLDPWTDLPLVRYYFDLAGDFLQAGLVQSFMVSLSRGVTILELSQSKKGFLRRIMNTFRKENVNYDIEPPKKRIFSPGYGTEGGDMRG